MVFLHINDQIVCAGALITYLNKRDYSSGGEDGQIGPVGGLEIQPLGGGMYITSDTIRYIPTVITVF